MNSQDLYFKWLKEIISYETSPKEIIAYNIGLFESKSSYMAYFMGSRKYDEEDNDWACDFDDYTPRNQYLSFESTELSKVEWKLFLQAIIDYTQEFIKSAEFESSFLKNAIAITVGFDDGDLYKVYP